MHAVARIIHALRFELRRRAARRALEALEPRILEDIGIRPHLVAETAERVARDSLARAAPRRGPEARRRRGTSVA